MPSSSKLTLVSATLLLTWLFINQFKGGSTVNTFTSFRNRASSLDSLLTPLDLLDDSARAECESWMAATSEGRWARKVDPVIGLQGSQYWQDAYLNANFFKNRTKGYYVDAAAAFPRLLSNTYFYDKCLGWEGLCIEAHPGRASELRATRSCTVVEKCLSAEDGTKIAFWAPIAAGSTLSNGRINAKGKFAKSLPKEERFELTCMRMDTILKEQGVTHMDYFSLDVEGQEEGVLTALAAMPGLTIDIMTMEVSSNKRIVKLEELAAKVAGMHNTGIKLGVDQVWQGGSAVIPLSSTFVKA
jgi:hypothetical protein